jgi:hypothetical protein
MNLYRKFVLSAAGTTAIALAAYYTAFIYQFGAPIPSGYDAANWITYKEQVGNNTKGNRILLFGDSSTVFGVNSKILSEKSGMPVANMALHGGLPLDAITSSAIKNSREGDTVVMALVWPYFFKDYKAPEDWILREMVAWYGDYFDGLPLLTKLKYVAAIDIKTLYTNIDAKSRKDVILKEFPYRRPLTKEEVQSQHAQIDWNTPHPFSYTFLNMNSYGDMQGNCGNSPILNISSFEIYRTPEVNKNVLQLLEQTATKLKEKGVAFYVIPSVTVLDERSTQEYYHKALNNTMNQIKSAGVQVLGTPEDFYFPKSSFYDTAFHINCESTAERTIKVYNTIKDVLVNKDS